MATAPNYRRALITIGKAMGRAKFDDHLHGAMFPSGQLPVDVVLGILYDKKDESVRKKLEAVMNEEFHRRRNLVMGNK